MEMKRFQKAVIEDLTHYLDLLKYTKSSSRAFEEFWKEKAGLACESYQDILSDVPHICFKVPTGGGKTFIACNSISPIFSAFPSLKKKAVVWLVPSEAILTQTLKALKDSHHPYRQKLDVDFSSRVEIYSKEELLNGQNFSPVVVEDQLSVMVLSYDSFRSSGKEGLKAYKENGNLTEFSKAYGKPDCPIEKADEMSLFQIINQLNPLVIVDESHHARSELSLEMLKSFNPCFVLDLTATPKKESNILSYVGAVQLKSEHMIKLPVIVFNRDKPENVIADAIDLRGALEKKAIENQKKSGNYIRPIVLFQAQSKGKGDATTFEKIREELIKANIPGEGIAIRTSEINELKGINLLSETCPIRYIITVNALKEGWDCPFAYILASIANRSSPVDVEQVLGRILRLPYATEQPEACLNISYVLTSSGDFKTTVQNVIAGLNNAGFSDNDCRVGNDLSIVVPKNCEQLEFAHPLTPKPESNETEVNSPDTSEIFDGSAVREEMSRRSEQRQESEAAAVNTVDSMLDSAIKAQDDYNKNVRNAVSDPELGSLPEEVRKKMTVCKVHPSFQAEIESLKLPQFCITPVGGLDLPGGCKLLEKEDLVKDFTLNGLEYNIDFQSGDADVVKVDVAEGALPKMFNLNTAEKRSLIAFGEQSLESQLRDCKQIIYTRLNKINSLTDSDIRNYVDLVINNLDIEQRSALLKDPNFYAGGIESKINGFVQRHCKKKFNEMIQAGEIYCEARATLPPLIHPCKSENIFGKSLYESEEAMNGLERKVVGILTGLPNVRWWHRNIAKQGFFINAYVNHYPDLIVKTKNGKIVLVETKGEHLQNNDTQEKLEIGNAWRNLAGSDYRYFMVFESPDNIPKGSYSITDFTKLMEKL